MDIPQVIVKPVYVPTTLPVFVCSLSAFKPQLALAREGLDELRLSHPESTESNVRASYMSPWRSHLLNPKFAHLCDSVVTIAKFASANYLTSSYDALNMDLVVQDCWGAIYTQADHTELHNHFPADFGCVVYLEADKDCAPIVFANNFSVQPEADMLLLFPGLLDHAVPTTAARRVVISMNLYKRAMFARA